MPLQATCQDLVLPGLVCLEPGHEVAQISRSLPFLNQLRFKPTRLVLQYLDGVAGSLGLVMGRPVAVDTRYGGQLAAEVCLLGVTVGGDLERKQLLEF